MDITIEELEQIISIIIQELKSITNKIEVKSDYYWSINNDEMFDVLKEPTRLTIGQISFDIDYLKKLLDPEWGVTSYDLRVLGMLLISISKDYNF